MFVLREAVLVVVFVVVVVIEGLKVGILYAAADQLAPADLIWRGIKLRPTANCVRNWLKAITITTTTTRTNIAGFMKFRT
ncbi:MAG: hypothetical protein JRJ60_19295 [Deltaproteobacteria bacterium]|nr:hypothetical protein [Deltaproteobacteria bacterium]